MVHGQAIGIPFRRRKGEQAPPPPKEVAWNPTIESNLPYKSIRYYKLSDSGSGWSGINIGDYIPVGKMIMITIDTVNAVDELVSAVSSQLIGIGINGSNGTYNITGTLTSESPQKINITIDEYIRFEDIVQAYPLFFEFTDENGNLISWGGKAKVGSTITRTKSVSNANLLAGLYNTSNYKLNGKPLEGNSCIVEKSMVFTCTATWKLSNEPNCILSNQILPIPNSSYKYLGHQPDLSGHGNHGVFNNFEFAGMSGANGYTEQTFSNWKYNTAEKRAEFTISNDVKLNIAKVVMARRAILYTLIGDYTTNSIQRYKVTGVSTGKGIKFGSDASGAIWSKVVEEDGIYEIDWSLNVDSSGTILSTCILSSGFRGECDIVIEQVSQYPNGLVSDGVEDYLVNTAMPILTDYTWIIKRKRLNDANSVMAYKGNAQYTRSFSATNNAVEFPELISYQTKTNYNGKNINAGIETDGNTLYIFRSRDTFPYYCKAVFYKAMLYSKTIDQLSINMLKNLFALDILIDINHPIFKK